MTCPNCQPWVARDLKQWHIRQANMKAYPDVLPHTCPKCGGTDWATVYPNEARMAHIRSPRERNLAAQVCVAIALVAAILVCVAAISRKALGEETKVIKEELAKRGLK